MGSGLIWAGLGRGISEAGKTYGDTMLRATEADMAEERATKRAEMLETLKENRALASERKLEADLQAAKQGGQQILEQRELSSMQERAPSVTAETKGLIDAALTPEEKAKYYGTKAPDALDQYDAQIESARDSGSVGAVRALREARKDTLDEIREDNKVKRDEAKDANAKAELERRERRGEQQHQEAMTRIGKLGSGGGSGGGSVANEKLEVTKAREKRLDIQKRIDVTLNQVKERLITKAEGQAKIKELEAQQAKYDSVIDGDESTKKTDKSPGNGGKSTPITSLPKGAVQIGTSGGKPVYQTPDGKKFKAD